MTAILDTHAFLGFCQDDPLPSVAAKTVMEDAGNRKLVSVASCWEIAIKAGLGKLTLGEPSGTYLHNALGRTGFDLLAIALAHATGVETLPGHHKYPFDRRLISQALAEGIPIIRADRQFDVYRITRLW